MLIVDNDPLPEAAPALETLSAAGRLLRWDTDSLSQLRTLIPAVLQVQPPCAGLRVRHVRKAGLDWFMLFNEGGTAVEADIMLPVTGSTTLVNPITAEETPFTGHLQLEHHALRVITVR